MNLNNSNSNWLAQKVMDVANLNRNAANKFTEVADILYLIESNPVEALKSINSIEAMIKEAGQFQTDASLEVMRIQATLTGKNPVIGN